VDSEGVVDPCPTPPDSEGIALGPRGFVPVVSYRAPPSVESGRYRSKLHRASKPTRGWGLDCRHPGPRGLQGGGWDATTATDLIGLNPTAKLKSRRRASGMAPSLWRSGSVSLSPRVRRCFSRESVDSEGAVPVA